MKWIKWNWNWNWDLWNIVEPNTSIKSAIKMKKKKTVFDKFSERVRTCSDWENESERDANTSCVRYWKGPKQEWRLNNKHLLRHFSLIPHCSVYYFDIEINWMYISLIWLWSNKKNKNEICAHRFESRPIETNKVFFFLL